MKKYILLLILCCNTVVSVAQNFTDKPLITKDSLAQKKWVDSTYAQFSLDEKIGQLFMVDVFSEKGDKHTNIARNLIENYHIGGIIFSKGGPYRQAKLTNEFQEKSKLPLLIAMDAEWGLAMRLDSTYAFPWNMTLGAIKDPKIVENVGYQVGKHAKRLGVHINFAPVVDINTNPKNPIIGNRSFGENKENVAQKSIAFMNGMHQAGVLSNAKHFPGHGDTDQDSHKTLPSLTFSKERIEEVELYPFQKTFDAGISSVMIAHLNVPSLVEESNLPTSLSTEVVTDMLQNDFNYSGLIFTDALNMKGVSNYAEPGKVDLKAFMAGADVLLISEDVPKAVAQLKKAYLEQEISEERLAHSVKKILKAKYQAGLHDFSPIEEKSLYEDLNTIENQITEIEVFKNAITVLKNDLGVLPVKNLQYKKIAYLALGDDSGEAFFDQMKAYHDVDKLDFTDENVINQLKKYDKVIIGHHKADDHPWKDYRFSEKDLQLVQEIAQYNSTILINFTSPYALMQLKSYVHLDGIVQAYQNSIFAQSIAAQIVFGAQESHGKLPVSIGTSFPEGTGFYTKDLGRLGFSFPENVGMDSEKLAEIDSIAKRVLKEKMSPGFQVLIARKGDIVYQKNFGYHTYDKKIEVADSSVYDLASLTKILSTLPLFMMLEEKGEFDLDDPIYQLLPDLYNSNKAEITLKEMLSHYGRLKSWIPFYQETLIEKDKFYSPIPTQDFNIQVAEKMYLRNDYKDTIHQTIVDSDLRSKLEYKYSDLPYYLLKDYIELALEDAMENLADNYFYEPMGLKHLSFHPLDKFDFDQIVPTEDDKIWRNQLLQGYVHDQGAAMLGGVGGHAGLFGNATDVAKIMQLYINKGSFGGKQYLQPATIDRFNTCYYCEEDVRRGVGFDKPQLENEGPTCGCLSMTSFGHSGFTGTYAWADPEEEIIFVFLSNRIHPDASNKKLIKENIRTDIQGIIYDSIIDF
ncbi:MAG: glycoside hydrolase family 3 N-terminal domain-containing protein [Bacteroidota bacterium]